MRRKISAHVDGGPSGGYRVRYPGARTPIGVSGNYTVNQIAQTFTKHWEIAGKLEIYSCGILYTNMINLSRSLDCYADSKCIKCYYHAISRSHSVDLNR